MGTQLSDRLRLSGLLGLGIADIHGRLIEANDEYLRILGYTRDDLEHGRVRWDACTVPEHLMRDHRAIRDVVEKGRCAPYEKTYVRKDGAHVPVLIGLSQTDPSSDELMFYVADLSQSPRDDSHLTDAVNAANTGIWDWSITTGRLTWSARAAILLGHSPPYEPSLENLYEYIHPDDEEAVRTRFARGNPQSDDGSIEFRVCPPNEPQRWILAKGAAFFNQAGEPIRASGTLVDISDWKRNEMALEEAVRVRSQFISVASHELRTPLTSIRLRAQMLLRTGSEATGGLVSFAACEASMRSIVRQVARMDTLVSDMLDASRLQHGKLEIDRETVNVVAMLEAFVRDALEDHPASSELVWEAPTDAALLELEVLWSRRRVEQVLGNLVGNAMKYGAGHPVVVRLAEVNDGWATIEVIDRGIGIAKHLLPVIFQPFGRATSNPAFPGAGLGLFIVSETVEALGGRVSVDSELGRGSTFRIHLPLNEPQPEVGA